MKKLFYIFLIAFASLALSCGQRPSNVLPKDKMIDVLYDLQLAQSVINNRNIEIVQTEEGKSAVMNSVLSKYKISQEILDSSIMWYSDNLMEYKAVNDSVVARLRKKVQILREEDLALRGISTIKKDTIPAYFYLDRSEPRYTFLFTKNDIVEDSITDFSLNFKVLGLNERKRKLETKVYFIYSDTTVVNQLEVNKDSVYQIQKPSLPDSLLTTIQGYFRLENVSRSIPVKIYDVKYVDRRSAEDKEFDALMNAPKN